MNSRPLAAGNVLNAYETLKDELAHVPNAADIEALEKVHRILLGQLGQGQSSEEKLTHEQLNTLALSLDELVKLASLVEAKRVLLKSLHKVTNSLLIGQAKDAQEHQLEMADKAWATIHTWLNGQSLQPVAKEKADKPNLVIETEAGKSIRTVSGGLPTLSRRN